MKFEIPLIEQLHRRFNPPPPIQVPFDVGYSNPFWTPPKVEEQAVPEAAAVESEAVRDAAELPPEITPFERDLAAEARELCQPLTEYLLRFSVVEAEDWFEEAYKDPLSTKPPQSELSPQAKEFEARKTALEADLRKWTDLLCQFLEDHRSWRTADLRAAHAEAWSAAREQQDVVEGIVAEHDQFTQERRTLTVALNKARSLFHSHETVKPDLAMLPSQSDLDAWKAEHLRLESEYEKAQQLVDSQLERGRRLAWKYEQENTKLAALLKAEANIRARLGGEDVVELGLSKPTEL